MSAGIPDDLKTVYEQLLVQDVQRRLPGRALNEIITISLGDVVKLLSIAGYLAMSEGHEKRTVSYEIATRTVALNGKDYPGVIRAAELVLTRLGNFPGRGLLRQRFQGIQAQEPLVQFEMRMHEIGNTIRGAGGQKYCLTDFQFETLHAFTTHHSVSVSAPTSAGKSFLLGLEVLRKLQDQRPAGIAYLVPTRALIRQVVVDLRTIALESGLPFPLIRSVPRVVTREEAPNGIIYVLTQERLLSLLNPEEGQPWLTALIVDEAQGIGDGARGVLLHTAIETVLMRFPKADVIFARACFQNQKG